MVDDLTQQPTDVSQNSQIPPLSTETSVKVEVPEAPQSPDTQSVPEPNPQPIETPSIQEPIAQEPPVIPPEPLPSKPIKSVQFDKFDQSSQNPQPIPIPQLRFPFNENFPLTFSFGAQSTTNEMKQKFSEWGISGHHGLDFAY